MVYGDSIRVHEGFWKVNYRHGKGYERYPNGNKYIGDFNMGKANGFGKYIWKTGETFEGSWING
jgi:hypothetical protein